LPVEKLSADTPESVLKKDCFGKIKKDILKSRFTPLIVDVQGPGARNVPSTLAPGLPLFGP
jgi:hypothetical protein